MLDNLLPRAAGSRSPTRAQSMIFAHPITISLLCLIGMAITAIAAAVSDWRSWRIPNQLLAASASAALMLAAFDPNSLTLSDALLGCFTGLLMLLPFYLMRGMAAGDVKLMAVIGLYAGPLQIFDIALASFLIGGLWSLAILTARMPSVSWALLGIRSLLRANALPPVAACKPPDGIRSKRGVFPFGVAIGIATLAMAMMAVLQRGTG